MSAYRLLGLRSSIPPCTVESAILGEPVFEIGKIAVVCGHLVRGIGRGPLLRRLLVQHLLEPIAGRRQLLLDSPEASS